MGGRKVEDFIAYRQRENELGRTIRAWRQHRKMTLAELANLSGFGNTGRGYISKIEHGQIRYLGPDRLKRMAEALQISVDDLLHYQMPEEHREVSIHDLDKLIICGKALLNKRKEESPDWGCIQLRLAKLYRERATILCLENEKHSSLIKAQHCVKAALLVFTVDKYPRHFREATQLALEIRAILDAAIIAASPAFLKRFPPRSHDLARMQLLLARVYCDHAGILEGQEAKIAALTEAQYSIDIARLIFTQKEDSDNLKVAEQLSQKVLEAIRRLTDSQQPPE